MWSYAPAQPGPLLLAEPDPNRFSAFRSSLARLLSVELTSP